MSAAASLSPSLVFLSQLWHSVTPQRPVHAEAHVQTATASYISIKVHKKPQHTGRHLLPFHHTAVNRALPPELLWPDGLRLSVSSWLRMKKSFWHVFFCSPSISVFFFLYTPICFSFKKSRASYHWRLLNYLGVLVPTLLYCTCWLSVTKNWKHLRLSCCDESNDGYEKVFRDEQ